MKTSCLVIALLAAGVLSIQAQYQVVEHGANYRVWQTTNNVGGTNRIHKYTELATGMYYTNSDGQWVESREEIETFARGAIARQGPYQVIFANNLNSAGAIDVQTPDGKRLRSNILGLAYNDDSTGQSVLIAQIQNSQGELISSNQVLYPDAFDGVVKADVRYTYKKGSFEQDVILRTQPPAPESFGLNPQTTEIEVLTEFINPPAAKVGEHKMKGRLKNNSLPDDEVDWGVMRIGHGRAFDLGETRNSHSRVTVRRQYMTANGRNILVEGVSMQSIRANLANLPRQTSASAKLPAVAFKTLALPKTPLAKVKQRPMRLASASPSNTGFLLDYVELNTDQDDYTFASGQTYYISGNVYISGTATIQGGAVIKYDTNSASSINILGTVECQTTPYWPAILTSSSDDTAGEPISAGNGSSCSCYGTLGITVFNCLDSGEDLTVYISDDNGTYLVNGETVSGGIRNYQDFSFMAGLGQRFLVDSFDTDGNEYYYDLNAAEDFSDLTLEGGPQRWDYYYQEDTQTPLCSAPPYPSLGLCLANGGSLNDLQFRNLDCGVESYGNCSVANLQFVQCGTAFDMENATLYAGNILMSHVGTGFAGQGFQVASGQLTFDQGSHVAVDSGAGGSWVTLSNALVTSVGDYGNVAVYTNSVATQADDTAIYQTGPLGNYYLPPDSPFIDAGTPTADKLGLYWWTTQTNQAIDGVTPVDLGYHYPAVDSNGNPVSTEVPGVPDYISDPNGNGLPDAWEIQYFGNLNHSASELDGVGNTLLFDYQHSANPNVSRYDAAGGMTFTNGLKMFIFEPKPASQIP